jgi:hypothetical protein
MMPFIRETKTVQMTSTPENVDKVLKFLNDETYHVAVIRMNVGESSTIVLSPLDDLGNDSDWADFVHEVRMFLKTL